MTDPAEVIVEQVDRDDKLAGELVATRQMLGGTVQISDGLYYRILAALRTTGELERMRND